MDGIMEVTGYKAYDIKYLGNSDISYNPALGQGKYKLEILIMLIPNLGLFGNSASCLIKIFSFKKTKF